jgi:hypothetical protein
LCVFYWPSSSAARRSWPAQFGDQRNHAGGDADYQPIGSPAFVVPVQQPAGAAGQIGHVRTPFLQDQIEAGAQPIPAFLEGCDAGVAAADLEGDHCGGKCFLQLVDLLSHNWGL